MAHLSSSKARSVTAAAARAASGSTQRKQPLAPKWPKADGERRSPIQWGRLPSWSSKPRPQSQGSKRPTPGTRPARPGTGRWWPRRTGRGRPPVRPARAGSGPGGPGRRGSRRLRRPGRRRSRGGGRAGSPASPAGRARWSTASSRRSCPRRRRPPRPAPGSRRWSRCGAARPGPARGLEREAAGVGQQVAEGDALAGPGTGSSRSIRPDPTAARAASESSAWSPRPPRTRRRRPPRRGRPSPPRRRDHRHPGPPDRPVQLQFIGAPPQAPEPPLSPGPPLPPQALASSTARRRRRPRLDVPAEQPAARLQLGGAGGQLAGGGRRPAVGDVGALVGQHGRHPLGRGVALLELGVDRTAGRSGPKSVVDSLMDSSNSAKATVAAASWSPARARWIGAVERRAQSLSAAASSSATSAAVPTRVTRSRRGQLAWRRTTRSWFSGRRAGTRTSPTPWLRSWVGGERRAATGSWSGADRTGRPPPPPWPRS